MSQPAPAKLFVLDDRLVPYLIRTSVEVVSIAVIAGVIVYFVLGWTRGVTDFGASVLIFLVPALLVFGSAWVLLKRVANLVGALLTARRAVDVALDEGGLRFAARGGPTYWPIDEMDEPLVIGKWIGKVELVLTHRADERTERIVLFHPQAIAEAQWLGREVRRRIDGLRQDLPAGAQELQPAGADLATWRKRIEGVVRSEGGQGAFRTAKLAPDDLAALAEDHSVPPALRAGATYGWLRAAPLAAQQRVAALLTEAAPPLLVAMAALAARNRKLVDRKLLAAALAYVDDDIRLAALQAQREG